MTSALTGARPCIKSKPGPKSTTSLPIAQILLIFLDHPGPDVFEQGFYDLRVIHSYNRLLKCTS